MAKKTITTTENTTAKETQGIQGSTFFNDTKNELSKVVWPSRQQLFSESAAVILMVTLVATVIYLVDNFFTWGASKVFLG